MKKFLIFTIKILLLIFMVLVVLDITYTKVYTLFSNRGKVEYVYKAISRNYDVVILGSSRANNHFVTPLFEGKGLKAYNYGMSGGHLFEASLLLKLMIERHYKIKNVILEADLNLSNENQADGVSCKYLPYIHDSKVIENHFSKEVNFWQMYYIPFYRYIAYETRIGFREMFLNAIHKETPYLSNQGYYALGKNPNANMKNDLTNLKPLHNKYYEEIKEICSANNINFIAVMTPMCSNVKGVNYFDKVNKMYPEIHNYENAVEGDQYFSSCGHMNDTGARLFTTKILKDFFNK